MPRLFVIFLYNCDFNYVSNNIWAADSVRASAGSVASLGGKYYQNHGDYQTIQHSSGSIHSHSCYCRILLCSRKFR